MTNPNPVFAASRSDRLEIAAGAILGVTAMLLLKRYWGIDHDAALYLGQALKHRFPDILGQDLFFAYGGQASYTVFPWLLDRLIALTGAPAVFRFGTLACLAFFAASSWYCLDALLPRGQRFWAWLAVLCLPPMYGWTGIFSYAEAFLTPRIPSEALSLLSIGLVARRKWLAAAACAAIAALLHPLQVIAMLFIVWPWLVMQDRRWLQAAWMALPVCLLAITGVSPFDALFDRLDPDWRKEIATFTRQVFVTGWSSSDYEVLVLDGALLAYGWRTLRGKFGTFCAAALAGLALALASSLVLVDALGLVLPAQLQLWRAHWLAHWSALAVVACLLHRDLKSGENAKALLLALTCTLVWGTSGWLWVAFAALYGLLAWRPRLVRPQLKTLMGWMFALGILVILALYAASEWLQFRQAKFSLEDRPFDQMLLLFPVLSLGIPLLARWCWYQVGRNLRWLLFATLLFPAFAFALARWDAQPQVLRSVERVAFRNDLFGTVLPTSAQVFWDKLSMTGPWLVLNRADYYSPQQLSGIVFSKTAAEEAGKRRERLKPLLDESLRCQDSRLSEQARDACHLSSSSLRLACAPGTSRAPDYLVLPYRQPQASLGSWTISHSRTGVALVTYRLYDCRTLVTGAR